MKISINNKITEGAWGGGNQFLKALRKYFIKQECYAESLEGADVILFNSHHELKSVLKLKWLFKRCGLQSGRHFAIGIKGETA
jgi:hypothetical protein